jgi:hypothetical protein
VSDGNISSPPEVIEFLDNIANRLLHLILSQDIIPVLPVWKEVDEDALSEIIDKIFTPPDYPQPSTLSFLTQLRPTAIPIL